MREQLERGAECSCKKTAGTCRKLLKQESWLWTFVWVEGIEPTNNDAERVLASCGAVAQEQRRNRQRSGQPIRRADAQRRGHLSAAESQRLGVADRVLPCAARRLRCPFSAARRGRTGRRLIGEFWPGAGCSGAQSAAHISSPGGHFRPDSQEVWDFLGANLLATLATVAILNRVPFEIVPGVRRGLNGYPGSRISLRSKQVGLKNKLCKRLRFLEQESAYNRRHQ